MKAKEILGSAIDGLRKEYGDDFKFEDGKQYFFVLKNAILELGVNDGNLKINFVIGEPIHLDVNVEL